MRLSDRLLDTEIPLTPKYVRNLRLLEAMNKARLNQRDGNGILRIRQELAKNQSFFLDGTPALKIENDVALNRFKLVIYKRIPKTAHGKDPQIALVVPHQLPTTPPDFTGRSEELERLVNAVASGGAIIAGLRGMGGIGKTTLALKLAERLSQRYPDGQFFIDMRGTSNQPLSSNDALRHVIRAFYPAVGLPEDTNELQAMYRSVLHDKRVLLVLDNASGAEQVTPLIPPPNCSMLITSRVRFSLPGLYASDLDTLRPNEAIELLFKMGVNLK